MAEQDPTGIARGIAKFMKKIAKKDLVAFDSDRLKTVKTKAKQVATSISDFGKTFDRLENSINKMSAKAALEMEKSTQKALDDLQRLTRMKFGGMKDSYTDMVDSASKSLDKVAKKEKDQDKQKKSISKKHKQQQQDQLKLLEQFEQGWVESQQKIQSPLLPVAEIKKEVEKIEEVKHKPSKKSPKEEKSEKAKNDVFSFMKDQSLAKGVEILGELKYVLLDIVPALAALGSIALLIAAVTREILEIDKATEDYTKSLGKAYEKGLKFDHMLGELAQHTTLMEEDVRNLGKAGVEAGFGVSRIADQIPEIIEQIGLGTRMMDLHATTAMEMSRNYTQAGGSIKSLGGFMDRMYRRMTKLNMSASQQEEIVSQTNQLWEDYSGTLDRNFDVFQKGVVETKVGFEALNVKLHSTKELLGAILSPKRFKERFKQAAFVARMTGQSFGAVLMQQQTDMAKFQRSSIRASIALQQQTNKGMLGKDIGQIQREGGLPGYLAGEGMAAMKGEQFGLHDETFKAAQNAIKAAGIKGGQGLISDKQLQDLQTRLRGQGQEQGLKEGYEGGLAKTPSELARELQKELQKDLHEIATFIREDVLMKFVPAVTHWMQTDWQEFRKGAGDFFTNFKPEMDRIWSEGKPLMEESSKALTSIAASMVEIGTKLKILEGISSLMKANLGSEADKLSVYSDVLKAAQGEKVQWDIGKIMRGFLPYSGLVEKPAKDLAEKVRGSQLGKVTPPKLESRTQQNPETHSSMTTEQGLKIAQQILDGVFNLVGLQQQRIDIANKDLDHKRMESRKNPTAQALQKFRHTVG